MQLTFHAVDEPEPGAKFQAAFVRSWPAYRRWWLSEGQEARPTYLDCRRAIQQHMPETLPRYERLCDLAGGGDHEARFLSLYSPPAYAFACSQAAWAGDEPLLVRNYDYDPRVFDALILRTQWLGPHAVLGNSDCLVGLLDGLNGAGVAVSLTFGGSRATAPGFGIPAILRYVLETCETTSQAARAIARIPSHMAYNVTVVDRAGAVATVMIAPGRGAVVTNTPVATNHQEGGELTQHARATASVERERFLLQRLTLHPETAERFSAAFLRPPLYALSAERGISTLYTAEMWPARRELVMRWPQVSWRLSLDAFSEDQRQIGYAELGATSEGRG